jgi:hypothetical protein
VADRCQAFTAGRARALNPQNYTDVAIIYFMVKIFATSPYNCFDNLILILLIGLRNAGKLEDKLA